MKRAAFAGSFDPPTRGHLDIIERGSRIFDKLYVFIASNPEKKSALSVEERIALLKESTARFNNVIIDVCPPGILLVDFLRAKKIEVMLRGVRDTADFTEEWTLATINAMLSSDAEHYGIDTVFLPARPEFSVVSSSAVRTIAKYKGDISAFVSPETGKALNKIIAGGKK